MRSRKRLKQSRKIEEEQSCPGMTEDRFELGLAVVRRGLEEEPATPRNLKMIEIADWILKLYEASRPASPAQYGKATPSLDDLDRQAEKWGNA
jgi:hypothetical protein